MDVNSARIPQPTHRPIPYRGGGTSLHTHAKKTASSSKPPQAAKPRVNHQQVAAPSYPQDQVGVGVRRRLLLIVTVAVAIVAIVAGGLYFYTAKNNAVVAPYDDSKYQAVFLAGGQVYFGKIDYINDNYLKLGNVFYIQSDASESKSDSESKTTGTDDSESGSMKLIKLGDEVHGPEDSMTINRDQVLFFEDLKADGKVAKLIDQYRQGN